MKNIMLLRLVCLLSFGLVCAAPAAIDPVGNWQGTLEAGSVKLRILFKITKGADGALAAKMDSLDQGARDIPVDTVTLKDRTLRLEVTRAQGTYEGTIDPAGTKATGQWQQGGQSLPLTLEKTKGPLTLSEPEKLSPAELAASKQAALKLVGTWNGTLAAGATNLRLRVRITKTPAGAATGTMDSLDQGANDIPLSAITLKEGKVRFEARGIGGSYEGTLAADGQSLSGEWHQSGQSLPLDLKKTPAGP